MEYKEIMEMTALQMGRAIKEKKLTPVEACRAVLKAIEEKDSSIGAYITVCEQQALERAAFIQEQLEAGNEELLASPLAGVPISVKDNICTKGVNTSCGSKILDGFEPFYDATVVEKYEKAGMILIGKTNMDEFAMGSTTETSFFGPTKNPWNLSRVPGGSSGGSAAAIASGESVCALGSDTGGSIRQPASYCGVTGFKPTYGTVSRFGLIAYASSLDQIGPLARDVEDCAAMMDVIRGEDKKDGTSLPEHLWKEQGAAGWLESLDGQIENLKIGVPVGLEKGIEPAVKESLMGVAETLEGSGAALGQLSLDFLNYVIPVYYIIAAAEASSNLSRFDGVKYGFRAEAYDDLSDMYSKTRSEGFGAEVKKRILLGTFVLSSGYYDAYYKKALQVKAIIKKSFDTIFQQYDALLLPAAPTTAPLLGESLKDPLKMYLADVFTVSANIAGLPALSVPAGFDEKGMPVGIQIIGPALADKKILNIGYRFQQETCCHKKRIEVK